jgi:hypothetical protein
MRLIGFAEHKPLNEILAKMGIRPEEIVDGGEYVVWEVTEPFNWNRTKGLETEEKDNGAELPTEMGIQ